MTKQERLKRYKKAYMSIYQMRYEFMCHSLYQSAATVPHGSTIAVEFPEFALMAPSKRRLLCGDVWFSSALSTFAFDASNIQSRLTILAFCIAMCED